MTTAAREKQKELIAAKYRHLSPMLTERSRRCWAATETRALGRGGLSIVSEAIGIDHKTVQAGLRELLEAAASLPPERVRHPGGGRKKLTDKQPDLLPALDALVEPAERGDPEMPVRWTTASTAALSETLTNQGHSVSGRTAHRLLKAQKYSLQANRKTEEGKPDHPDRGAQFRFISDNARKMLKKNQPVISVDAKKKELVGNYKNNGQEWRPKGNPRSGLTHDFPDKNLGKVAPYGVCGLSRNEGWVNVGIDHDAAEFAVESIRRWWNSMGNERYPEARELMIAADSGGSNSRRSRLWKAELQKLADELALIIHVTRFPPGTSKWNKIEHRLFSRISQHWRGRPLIDRAAAVELIASATSAAGLTVKAMLDENHYRKGIKISDAEMESLNLMPESFHGEWNYRLEPRGG